MDPTIMQDGLISYLCLIVLITFHEFGHAWMAWKRGDDTARMLGRISLNPIVHMDLLGTVILPLLALCLAATGSGLSSFVIGWGKPVPVHTANLRNRGVDGVLVALAGPAMNIILGIASVASLRAATGLGFAPLADLSFRMAMMNFALCYFNLLPVPPLDGSHVLRYFIGMREETFFNLCRYGFFFVVVVIQIPEVRHLVSAATFSSLLFCGTVFGVGPAMGGYLGLSF